MKTKHFWFIALFSLVGLPNAFAPGHTNGNNNGPLAQPNLAPLADSSSESAEYNRGPQQIASANGHAAQVHYLFILTPAELAKVWQESRMGEAYNLERQQVILNCNL